MFVGRFACCLLVLVPLNYIRPERTDNGSDKQLDDRYECMMGLFLQQAFGQWWTCLLSSRLDQILFWHG